MRKSIDWNAVAEEYDLFVTTEHDIHFFRDLARESAGPVLELMCGTGRVSLPLLRDGVPLTCVDSSQGMLRQLEMNLTQWGLSADIHCQDVRELGLGRSFDLIFIAFNSFSELTSQLDQRRSLRCIRAHLSPKGLFVCTLHNPLVRRRSLDGIPREIGVFAVPGSDETLRLSGCFTYDPLTRLASGTQWYERLDGSGRSASQRSLDVVFYLFEADEFASLVESEGFSRVELFGDFDRSEFTPESPFMIWVLTSAG
jgi:SAM-dependent methyltransferase